MGNMSPYCAMNNNPVSYSDPEGDIAFFAIPQIGFGNGGLSFGLEVGIGVPGVLSASVTGGYGFGSGNGYWSVQGSAAGFYAGYGSGGAFAGWGYRYGGLSGGLSYNSSGWGAGLNIGGSQGNFVGSIGFGWNEEAGWGYNISGGYSYIHVSPLNFAPESLQPIGWHQVDSDLCELDIEPDNKPDISIASIDKISRTRGILKLLKRVSRPKIEFSDGLSEYDHTSGTAKIGKRDFTSWRLLTTAYGHELVHRYHHIVGAYGKFGKTKQSRRSVSESLAHYWSSQYSGIGKEKFMSYFALNRSTENFQSIFSKYLIRP